MSMLDDILGNKGNLGSIAELVAKNPQLLSAAMSLLSSKDTSVGGSGGLNGLVQAFQGHGLGDVVASWVGTGTNQAISPSQVTKVLGHDTLGQFAQKAGIPAGDAGSVLAGLLPMVIDKLTPHGNVPEEQTLESSLGGLLGGFLR